MKLFLRNLKSATCWSNCRIYGRFLFSQYALGAFIAFYHHEEQKRDTHLLFVSLNIWAGYHCCLLVVSYRGNLHVIRSWCRIVLLTGRNKVTHWITNYLFIPNLADVLWISRRSRLRLNIRHLWLNIHKRSWIFRLIIHLMQINYLSGKHSIICSFYFFLSRLIDFLHYLERIHRTNGKQITRNRWIQVWRYTLFNYVRKL